MEVFPDLERAIRFGDHAVQHLASGQGQNHRGIFQRSLGQAVYEDTLDGPFDQWCTCPGSSRRLGIETGKDKGEHKGQVEIPHPVGLC